MGRSVKEIRLAAFPALFGHRCRCGSGIGGSGCLALAGRRMFDRLRRVSGADDLARVEERPAKATPRGTGGFVPAQKV